jgi:Na+-driven multidrug efflux pump
LATLIGRSIGVLYQFYRLLRGTERLRILTRQVRLQWDVLLRLVRVSFTGILQFAIAHTSWIGLVRIVSIFGAAALAGYTIAIRIVIFVILPSWGLSNAAATLVGQNLGAGHPERAEKAVWRTGLYNVIFLGSIGVIFIFFPNRSCGCLPMIRKSYRWERHACASSAMATLDMPTSWS